jgi:hypothetical protein
MIKFTYSCNGTREDHRYCERGKEDGIVAGWNRLGKRTGHSYKIVKIEDADKEKNFERIGSSDEYVLNKF